MGEKSWKKSLRERFPGERKEPGETANSLLLPGLTAVVGWAVVSLFFEFYWMLCFLPVVFFVPALLKGLWEGYASEKRKKEKEEMVPDLLLQASVFPPQTPTSEIIEYLGKESFGALSKDFLKAGAKIRKGVSPEDALQMLGKESGSPAISRAASLLSVGHKTGADMGSLLRETAEDLLETQHIFREQQSSLLIEKITLIFAGGIVVPLIIGLSTGLVQGLDFPAELLGELGAGKEASEALLQAAVFGSRVYVAEYALLAAVFLSLQEGNIKKSFVYALFLLPLSLAFYFIPPAFLFG